MKLKDRSGASGTKNNSSSSSSGQRSTLIPSSTMGTPGYDHLASSGNNNTTPQQQQSGGGVAAGGLAALDTRLSDPSLALAAAAASLATQPIPPHDAQYQDQAQFEADKRSVYKHPLFPLLALLFEKCEMATQTAADSPISDSFHHDLEAFVQHQERDRKPFLSNDPEVDGLMIKAIQVLRIHLLELDKVQELCKDFCNRYITCLKGKMQSENLLRSDYYDGSGGGGGNNGVSHLSHSSHSNSPHHSYNSSSNGDASVSPPTTTTTNNGVFHLQGSGAGAYIPHSTGQQGNNSQSSGSSLLGRGPSPDLLSTGSSSHTIPPLPLIHGGTPLSQIGATTCPPSSSSMDLFAQTPPTPSSVEDDDDFLGRKKPKRGVLPKHATSIMRSWLFQHIVHPYPTEDEKRQIASQTNLTLLQVNNWFINARRRILQPMLDASNPESTAAQKVKKVKSHSSSKPALKYWSDNLAGIGPGHLDGDIGANGLNQNGDDSTDESEDSSNDCNDIIDNSEESQQ